MAKAKNELFIQNTHYKVKKLYKECPELEVLKEIIESHGKTQSDKYEETFTVSYEGAWGSGKTSRIIQFCKENKYKYVSIQLWKFTGIKTMLAIQEALLLEILSNLRHFSGTIFQENQTVTEESLGKEKTSKLSLKTGIQAGIIAKAGGGLASSAGTIKSKMIKNIILEKAPEKLGEILHITKSTIHEYISNKPFILILDDIDRVESCDVYNILQSIKAMLEIPGVVSVVPINTNKILNDLLQNNLSEHKNDFKAIYSDKFDYLSKFFNYSLFHANTKIKNNKGVFDEITK